MATQQASIIEIYMLAYMIACAYISVRIMDIYESVYLYVSICMYTCVCQSTHNKYCREECSQGVT